MILERNGWTDQSNCGYEISLNSSNEILIWWRQSEKWTTRRNHVTEFSKFPYAKESKNIQSQKPDLMP